MEAQLSLLGVAGRARDRAQPWANLPTPTTAPFTDAADGTHMHTPPEETQVPPRVWTDCHVFLKAGVPGRVGERRWARPQVGMRGEGVPSAAPASPRGESLGPRAGPCHPPGSPSTPGGDMPETLSPGSEPAREARGVCGCSRGLHGPHFPLPPPQTCVSTLGK